MIAQTRSNTPLAWALLAAVIGWRLQDFFGVGMATLDQIGFSTGTVGRGLWAAVLDDAQAQGRIYFLLTKIVDYLAAIHATSVFTQALNLALFALAPWLVAWLVFEDGRERVLFLLVYWTLCTLGWHHTTPAAYPIVLTLPLALAGAAAAMARSHSRAPGNLKLLAFGCLAFAAFFQYEPAAVVAAVLLLWFIHARVADASQRPRLYLATAISLCLYAAAYAVWRFLHPSTYVGTAIGDLSLVAVARALAVFALGALPAPPHGMPEVTLGDATIGKHALPYPRFGIGSPLAEVEWMDIVLSIAAACLLWFVLSDRRTVPPQERRGAAGLAGVLGLGLALLIASNILVAMSRKYQMWAELAPSPYLTSYYALFGWVVLLTGLSRLLPRARAETGAVLALAAMFLYSGAANHFAGKQIRANFSKWQAVAALAACRDGLGSYRAFVLPAAYYGAFGTPLDWSAYWRDWTLSSFGGSLQIVPNAAGGADGPAAQVQPILDDRGILKAVAGRGDSSGFLIYRVDRPNYVWLRHAPGAREAGTLVVVERAKTSRCREGYRMVELGAPARIEAIDAYWQMPAAPLAGAPAYAGPGAGADRVVQALYLGFLGRPADPEGLRFWADRILRPGARIRDVATGFAASPETPAAPRGGTDFHARVTQAFQALAGRAPRTDEIARLARLNNDPDVLALVPLLAITDLLESRDAAFLNRLKLAQHYTGRVYPAAGWRPDAWRRSVKLVDGEPASLQRAIAALDQD